jgi:hypothetical protein
LVFETRCTITKLGVTTVATSVASVSFTPHPRTASWCFLLLEYLDEFAKLVWYLVSDGKLVEDNAGPSPLQQSCCVGDGTKLSFGFGLFVEGLASQFCCLRLLAGLLHIPKRRGSKETAVFTGEL